LDGLRKLGESPRLLLRGGLGTDAHGCEKRSFVAMLLPPRLRASRIEILLGISS
jgi:hypothetical protein